MKHDKRANKKPRSHRKREPALPKFTLSGKENEKLESLCERLGIDDWDFLIVGDGSGSSLVSECSWASISIERANMERLVWWGYANRGGVNYAEMQAYGQPLNWILNRELERRSKRGVRVKSYKVHVITDSTYVQGGGESGKDRPVKNSLLWEMLALGARHGVIVDYHWQRRTDVALNSLADWISKLVRLMYRQYNVQATAMAGYRAAGIESLYDINP
jgi:hypothetical protein